MFHWTLERSSLCAERASQSAPDESHAGAKNKAFA